MDREVAERIVTIQEIVQSDGALMEEYQAYHAKFLKMLPELTEMQLDILTNYLGICNQIHLKMLVEAIMTTSKLVVCSAPRRVFSC